MLSLVAVAFSNMGVSSSSTEVSATEVSARMALTFLELANWEIGLSGRERHQPRKCERLWTPPQAARCFTAAICRRA
jgi:hypothetical protein